MRESPAVSVVLPVYNDEALVESALDSILGQDFTSFEVIVVDDGSTDGTSARLESYRPDDRITLVDHEQNRGLPAALNTGLSLAEGKYLMRQDADDLSLPTRMQKQHDFLESNPDICVLTTGVEVIDESGDIKYSFMGPVDPGQCLDERNAIFHGAVMVRRQSLEAVGGYDEFFRFCQDYDLWIRLHEDGCEIRTLQEPLYQLRRDETLLSIEQRHRISIYAILARLSQERKQLLKRRAREEGIDTVYNQFNPIEQSRYHQRMSLANVEHGNRLSAARHAIVGILKQPGTPKPYGHLGLSLLPRPIIDRTLKRISGR